MRSDPLITAAIKRASPKDADFVGQFTGEKLQVEFTQTGAVTVAGDEAQAQGRFVAVGNNAVATFQTTNRPGFDHTIFTISDGGKEVVFLGPRRTEVKLRRVG